MVIEIFCSFLFVLIFLIQTEVSTRFTDDSALWSLVISGTYVALVALSSALTGGSLNPAYGICVNLTMLMNGDGFATSLEWVWFYAAMPLIGSLLALGFYELVYKKTITKLD